MLSKLILLYEGQCANATDLHFPLFALEQMQEMIGLWLFQAQAPLQKELIIIKPWDQSL